MTFDFDTPIDRRNTHASKWEKFARDVLPFWVADMDFAAPACVLDALRERLDHPILGYTQNPPSLTAAFQGWLTHHFDWQVEDEWVVWLPGVVPGLNLAAQVLAPHEALLIPVPVYHPFLHLAAHAGTTEITVPLARERVGHKDCWTFDFDALQAAVTPATRMLLICNPQNPTARCYSGSELSALAEFVTRNDLLLVSDEIHCNIVLDPALTHVPIAKQHPALAARTITLYSATKVYNIPGVSCAAAVIPDTALRTRFLDARKGLVPNAGPLGFAASEAAFNDRGPWMNDLVAYLRGNLELVREAVGQRMGVHDATYLAWIDVEDLALDDTESYFARHGIGISPGAQFGDERFIRFNFGTARSTLRTGLERLTAALEAR